MNIRSKVSIMVDEVVNGRSADDVVSEASSHSKCPDGYQWDAKTKRCMRYKNKAQLKAFRKAVTSKGHDGPSDHDTFHATY